MKMNSHALELLESQTPPTVEVQTRVQAYIQLAQISQKEMAQRISYRDSSLSYFMRDKYVSVGFAQTDVHIRRALIEFMDANPITISTETNGCLYETNNVRVLRHWFERCLRNREMAFAYGPPGAQKTFVAQHLIAQHNQREISKNGHGTRAYYVYCSQDVAPGALLRKLALAAAVPSAGNVLGLQRNLAYHLAARKTLFILDEAQHLSIPCLELVRELNDCPPHAAILLQGSHRLRLLFKDRAAELEQWNSRVSVGVELPGISTGEAAAIVESELGTLETKQLQKLIENSRVLDGYNSKLRYISARRLFNQIHEIKADPRFVAAGEQKESAA